MDDVIGKLLRLGILAVLAIFIVVGISVLSTIGVKSKCEVVPNSTCVHCFDGKFETIKCPSLIEKK